MTLTLPTKPDDTLQHLIDQCRRIANEEVFTLGGVRSLAEQVPFQLQKLLDSEAALMRLNTKQVELIRKEKATAAALQANLSDLRRQLKTRDNTIAHMEEEAAAELRGYMVLRDKFGAKPEETFTEFVTRLATERIALQESLQLTQISGSSQTLLNEVTRLEGLLNKETTENARLVAELTEAEIKIGEQAQVERTVNAALRRVDALEAKIQNHTGHSGLPISDLVHDAYQTAKDKGWHDPADENDVTVVETRQALCREGLRVWRICYIAEKIRKGQAPALQDYLRIFSEVDHRLSASDVRLISDLMLVITEVGEAIDDVLADRVVEGVDEKGKPIGLPSELADVVIRVAHICGHRKIDLAGAVQRKLRFNKTRPYKHGKRA